MESCSKMFHKYNQSYKKILKMICIIDILPVKVKGCALKVYLKTRLSEMLAFPTLLALVL